ncbi:hypothetical protein A3I46_03525 [Candidatus Kaiserbacteria bacterium RIFCSPLOWO2_02_FULL_54_13]|uniref:Restriction endonuclease n=1 Tax=Candidatus Kaiserbacteria bacterium RIFCSPHIGHO2_02_FULL_54_22 TaxID=1798495 RepID=A0A1F6DJJ1_9BACT|nr:MAG: hypothetical protein A3C19_00915 [Candidatus Kaiserbacteria bacterium RIFCSPHIGHO2_02_FULL_54_22]OGG69012.1 MAG: hypothetical protein A3E99_01570 [Candidatus Kaiserbacteria bacterium RIFCSPHIGHO2_12_FULL_54_16]OGG83152.1 MAG: hypothetical protein A3I46_03525 [Candidatus Kaiserbacteria bacterium RIFCSPLOWO2_02_FULL_54_13]
MNAEKIASEISKRLSVEEAEASMIVAKAITGGEASEVNISDWYEQRFLPNLVLIDEDGYSRMCIDALKILDKTAATDYGGSRQRDMGQLWADMTRGYLGEFAFQLFLRSKGIEITLGHEKGELSDYLVGDIREVRKSGEDSRPPKLQIGIKTTKWNGIWFDLPGDQFNHSAAHTFIKVGTGRNHLFAFFKKISVFKDKVLKVGQDIGLLTADESTDLYNLLPTFKPVPAYISGFVLREPGYPKSSYGGRKGRLHYKINSWSGPISALDLQNIKEKENITGRVEFEGIGKFSHDRGYLFNAGSLLWKQEDWKRLIEKM